MFDITPINKKKFAEFLDNSLITFLSLLAFLLPLFYFESLRDASSLPRYAVYGVSSGFLLCLVLIKRLFENKPPQILLSIFPAIFIFALWAWLSLLWSVDPKNSLIELLQLSGCIIIGYSITQINNAQLIKWLIISSIAGASLAAAIGILQYFNYNLFNYRQFLVPASTFTNPNIAATYLDLITPVSFSLILLANKNIYKWLFVASSILCLTFLLISHSRGSWLGLIFILIGLSLLLIKNSNFKILFIPLLKQNKFFLIASICIPLLIFSVPSPSNTVKQAGITNQTAKNSKIKFDSSAKIRLDAYINSLSMIKDHPVLGVGYGGFKIGFRNYMFSTVPFIEVTEDKVLAQLHSDPLQFFVELGFIGGMLFIYIYIMTLQMCWKIISTTNDSRLLLVTSGLFLSFIAIGIHACVDFPFHKPSSALQYWIWLGIISVIFIRTTNTKLLQINKFTVFILLIFGIFFSSYNFIYYQNYILASQSRLLVESSIKKNNCITAKKNADRMMELFDADFRHQSLYVAIYSQCKIDNSEKLFAMNRILTYDQTNTRAFITRGTIYLQQKSTQKAINDFLQVTRILPHRASGYIGLAYASIQNQNISAAIKLLKYAAKIEPENEISSKLLTQIQLK